jgi:AraC-like DNA-binding protein
MSELTLAAAGVRALMDFAVSRGASRSALMSRSRIDRADIEDPDNRIPFAKYVALMRASQDLCADPALALHFGEAVATSDITFTHQIGAATMVEAMATMNRYARLTVEVDDGTGPRYVLSRSGGHLWLIDNRPNANEFPELTESGFARMVCSMHRFDPRAQLLRAVHFTHAAPAYRAEYDRIFRVPVTFESDRNALLIDDAVLSFRPPTMPAYASKVLEARAEELLEKLDSSKSMRAQVETLLTRAMSEGNIGMERIGRELGLSRQTLFRRLKSENVTFEKVLDELRHRMALNYLNDRKLSVSQTSHLLGFSDPAAFSRAFKRWTGSSPRRVRFR